MKRVLIVMLAVGVTTDSWATWKQAYEQSRGMLNQARATAMNKARRVGQSIKDYALSHKKEIAAAVAVTSAALIAYAVKKPHNKAAVESQAVVEPQKDDVDTVISFVRSGVLTADDFEKMTGKTFDWYMANLYVEEPKKADELAIAFAEAESAREAEVRAETEAVMEGIFGPAE